MIVPKYFSSILMESSLIIKVLNRMIRIECVMSSYLSTSHVVPMMACKTSLSDLFWNKFYLCEKSLSLAEKMSIDTCKCSMVTLVL